jgi:hypothetical protein
MSDEEYERAICNAQSTLHYYPFKGEEERNRALIRA